MLHVATRCTQGLFVFLLASTTTYFLSFPSRITTRDKDREGISFLENIFNFYKIILLFPSRITMREKIFLNIFTAYKNICNMKFFSNINNVN